MISEQLEDYDRLVSVLQNIYKQQSDIILLVIFIALCSLLYTGCKPLTDLPVKKRQDRLNTSKHAEGEI